MNKGFFLVQSEACCDWTTRDQNVLIKGGSIFFLIVGVNIATVCVEAEGCCRAQHLPQAFKHWQHRSRNLLADTYLLSR